jgi:hypothetical protein
MILLNFSHPLTGEQITQVENLTGDPVQRVVEMPVQFDPDAPFAPQLQALLAGLPLSPAELQTLPILVNLPALSYIAALLLADLHGRMGYFPAVLRLRPVPGALPPRYEAVEVISLQAVRDTARHKR